MPYGGVYRSPADSTSPIAFTMITNKHGDVLELLDANGDAFASYRYDPWGSPLTAETTTQATSLITSDLEGYVYCDSPPEQHSCSIAACSSPLSIFWCVHLDHTQRRYAEHYDEGRPHRGLDLRTPADVADREFVTDMPDARHRCPRGADP